MRTPANGRSVSGAARVCHVLPDTQTNESRQAKNTGRITGIDTG